MRILLTGKNGQLGWELHRQLEQAHDVLALGRDDVDFRDSRFLFRRLRELPRLDLIVNAAAYTNVDKAEQEASPPQCLHSQDLRSQCSHSQCFVAETVNSEAAALLAAEADIRGIPLVHFSTDYVFGGQRRGKPYKENDPPNPVCYYGWTKREGEVRVRNILEKHWIFRLSGLYGLRRRNFFMTMLACRQKGITPRVVNDQIVSPNWTPWVAEAVAAVIRRLSLGEHCPWGTYHLSGTGQTTWYEFARLIFEKLNEFHGTKHRDRNVPLPVPVTTKEYGAIARRPKYSVLDPRLFNTIFQYTLPDWREQFLHFLGGLQVSQPQLPSPKT